jgi:hypothetical protein
MKKVRTEPFFRGDTFTGSVSEALTWYRKNSTATQQKQWVIDFLIYHNRITRLPFTDEKPFPADVVDRARACDEHGCIGVGSVARLLTKGVPLDKKTVTRLYDHIRSLKPKPPRAARPVEDSELTKIRYYIDGVIDDICLHRKPKLPSPNREKWRESLTLEQRAILARVYQKTYDEIFAAASEEDEELMEAYSNMSVFQMDALVNYLQSIVVYKKAKAGK